MYIVIFPHIYSGIHFSQHAHVSVRFQHSVFFHYPKSLLCIITTEDSASCIAVLVGDYFLVTYPKGTVQVPCALGKETAAATPIQKCERAVPSLNNFVGLRYATTEQRNYCSDNVPINNVSK